MEKLSLTRRETQVRLADSPDMLWFSCPSETAQKTCAALGKRGPWHPDTLMGHLGERCPVGKQLGRSVTSTQTQQFQSQGFFPTKALTAVEMAMYVNQKLDKGIILADIF